MLLTEIDHVAIAVSDLDAAIDYYERAFGATHATRRIEEEDSHSRRCRTTMVSSG